MHFSHAPNGCRCNVVVGLDQIAPFGAKEQSYLCSALSAETSLSQYLEFYSNLCNSLTTSVSFLHFSKRFKSFLFYSHQKLVVYTSAAIFLQICAFSHEREEKLMKLTVARVYIFFTTCQSAMIYLFQKQHSVLHTRIFK